MKEPLDYTIKSFASQHNLSPEELRFLKTKIAYEMGNPTMSDSDFDEWQELSPYVDQALEELDENTREMLIRHYLGGKSMRLVAEAMGVSQPTVSRKIDKGISQLRSILRKKGFSVSFINNRLNSY